MEPAHLGVILDSSILIEAERQSLDVAHFLKHVSERIGEREAAHCAISVAELAHGILDGEDADTEPAELRAGAVLMRA